MSGATFSTGSLFSQSWFKQATDTIKKMKSNICLGIVWFWIAVSAHTLLGQVTTLDGSFRHLRNGPGREWLEFPVDATEKQLVIHFDSRENLAEKTLSLRQYDVKQHWKVALNGKEIGSLHTDEKDMRVYFRIPAGFVRGGQNELRIECNETSSDDIRVGQIVFLDRPLDAVLSEATVEIEVRETDSGNPIPCRLTILNSDGVLQSVTSPDPSFLAIRPGVVYSGNGKASITLPAGRYKMYAGRGFEYSVDSLEINLTAGKLVKETLQLKREVNTDGWVSCDTHIHTFTHSRHGDATIEERAITIVAEGIEMPIITDHNINIDIASAARDKQVLRFFTSVVGDELTTKVGHFNVFPTTEGTPAIDYQVEGWTDVKANIGQSASVQVVILNHARDIHHSFRPFGPERHLSSAGTSADDSIFPANAMELINSGSQQTDVMQLFYDWFGMLNRGYFLTPVGSSDSHDVNRFIVGQGRTYIKANDHDPGNINIDQAIKNFRDGRVMVSLGLMTRIKVNQNYEAGDLVPATDRVTVTLEVAGPSWTSANRVALYANGKKIREEIIPASFAGGTKWSKTWTVPVPKHDMYLVAIAEGPGSGMPFWPIAKPYQAASIEWTPKLIGLSGAVWIDGDRNGKRNAAYDYAQEIVASSKGEINIIVKRLAVFDEAVAIQAAMLLWKQGKELTSGDISQALKGASEPTKRGFNTTIQEIRLLKNEKQ